MSPFDALILKFPSKSEILPVVVPFITIFTLGIGKLEESTIVPVIVCWAFVFRKNESINSIKLDLK